MARHDDLPVPVYKSLEPVYGTGSQLEEAELRFNTLKSKFLEFFGHAPDIYARSPGIVYSRGLIDWTVKVVYLVVLLEPR